MIRDGSWALWSETDDRWNKSGKGKVGMFMSYDSVPEASEWMDHCKKIYGEPPKDLRWSYIKD